MNDRFRFRAWDKIVKVMYSYELLREHCESDWLHFFEVFKSKNFIPMQCTGLKDKNVVLIFEGDIIYHETKYEDGSVTKHKKVIEFSMCCFMAKEINPIDTNMLFIFNMSVFEIIGNIYQHPELLNTANSPQKEGEE